MKWYIKERHNPQFKKPVYSGEGQLTQKEADKMEKPIYGSNIMLAYDTEEEYKSALEKFNNGGLNES